jgi:ArsR family transcriptional regulator
MLSPVKELIRAARAIADPSRLRILFALRDAELCVCELRDGLSITQSTLSTHLQVMRQAGMVAARKEGKWMYYALSPKGQEVLRALSAVFNEPLKKDRRLRTDAGNIKRRLSLRAGGACCVGYGAGKQKCAIRRR